MGLSSAVDWWEVWQLRILVLGSLGIQWLLCLSAHLRKSPIPSWCRSIIWLAYLGSDAVAIYGLATLFNRQRKQDYGSANSHSILEVVWAPVLLMHLGGQDRITAYNIEDNELWTRHVLTAVSQITVAIYVFCISWPGGDKRLLQASILLFVPGILKCIEKPWALKRASFSSLVSLSDTYLHPEMMTSNVPRFTDLDTPNQRMARSGGLDPGMASGATINVARPSRRVNSICKDISLEEYVQKARAFVLAKCHPQARGEGDTIDHEHNHVAQAEGEANEVDLEGNHHRQDKGKWNAADLEPNHVPQAQGYADPMDLEPSHHRQSHEKAYAGDFKPIQAPKTSWWWRLLPMVYSSELRAASLSKEKKRSKQKERWEEERKKQRRVDLATRKLFVDLAPSYRDRLSILETFLVQDVIKNAYFLLQEGLFKTFDLLYTKVKVADTVVSETIASCIRGIGLYLPFAAIGLYHKSHREAYDVNDVKVTYAMFCCTAVLQLFGHFSFTESESTASDSKTAQYSLLGFFVRNKRHRKKMSILSFFNCKDFLDQRWCMDSCSSSSRIVELVLGHVEGWWKEHIVDAASYRKFNDHRGQWTTQRTGCDQDLGWSINRPFDESVLLWHIATDFCLFKQGNSAVSLQNAMRCREISNYMMYLLFVNPEMLLSGTRRNLFIIANAELEEILKGDKPSLKKILKGRKPSLMEVLKCNKPFLEILKVKGPSSEEIERGFMQQIITKFKPTEHREDPEHTELPTEAEQCPSTQEGFIHDAWMISEVLLALGDEMWDVIEGVWVEMLCFSASRSRGFLHAKSLGTGGQLLTYIWLLLSRMGMETLPERLQRTELSSGGGNNGAALSPSKVSTTTGEAIF